MEAERASCFLLRDAYYHTGLKMITAIDGFTSFFETKLLKFCFFTYHRNRFNENGNSWRLDREKNKLSPTTAIDGCKRKFLNKK